MSQQVKVGINPSQRVVSAVRDLGGEIVGDTAHFQEPLRDDGLQILIRMESGDMGDVFTHAVDLDTGIVVDREGRIVA